MSNPGDLDTTFGTGGKVLTDIPGTLFDRADGVVIQSDGKIVVAGVALLPPGDSKFLVIRYNTDGSLDSSFGTGGIVTTSFTGNISWATAIAIDSNNKIVVVGFTGTYANFALARYTTNGTLDNTFGTGGQVITDFVASTNDNAYAVAVDSSNKIIVGGDIDIGGGSGTEFIISRYLENGSLDASFGGGTGYVVTDFAGGNDSAWALIIRSDGKILAGGHAEISGRYNFAMALYNTDGSLDTSFGGGDGKVETLFGYGDFGTTMAVQSDGKIILGGYASIDSANRSTIARYSADGILDTTFGTNSGYTPNTLGSQSVGYGLAVDTTDRILFGGNVVLSGNNDFLMARYTANGVLDTSFGTNGSVATSVGTPPTPSGAAAIVIQPSDGKIVAAGYATMSGGSEVVALLRYIGDTPGPTPPPTPTPAETTKSWISSLGGGIHGFIPKAVITTNNNYGYVRTRTIVRNQWSKQYLSAPKKVAQTPFRAINNAGDLLSRQAYSCGGPTQSFQSRPGLSGLKGSLGHVNRNCGEGATDTTEAAACNSKFVYDTSDYIRYRKQRAINKNYNDKSNGGNDSSGAQVAIRASRRFF